MKRVQLNGRLGKTVKRIQVNAAPAAVSRDIPQEKKSNLKWLIIAAAVLIIAGIAIAAIALFGGNDKTGDDPVTEEENAWIVDATEYNGHHYQVFNEPMRWDQAKEKCESMDGHLVYVEDSSEQAVIVDLVEASGTMKYHYWLGGTAESGEWKWLNGESIPMRKDSWGYENWENKKPNNNTEAAGYTGQEMCLEMQTTSIGREYMTWNDVDMDGIAVGNEGSPEFNDTKHYGFICEWDF